MNILLFKKRIRERKWRETLFSDDEEEETRWLGDEEEQEVRVEERLAECRKREEVEGGDEERE